MSLTADSPVNSSSNSSDDFAALLDAELDSISDVSPNLEGEEEEAEAEEGYDDDVDDDEDEDGDDDEPEEEKEGKEEDDEGTKGKDPDLDLERNKRQRVDITGSSSDLQSSMALGVGVQGSGASLKTGICTHPGVIGGLCIRCGERMDDESGVALGYIHKKLRLSNEEITRLRDKDLRKLLHHKKIYLVLDLDHTLLNSSLLDDINGDEAYLKGPRDDLPDALKSSLYRLDSMRMMTKLRPFVHSFLKEASKIFEMYIYTMGDRSYALEMAKLLDPEDIYFNSRVIANVDSTVRYQKGLDVVLGKDSAVLILDDTEKVWEAHPDNLILMERYHFFASSLRQFHHPSRQSLSELRSDESEADGVLSTVLRVLKKTHSTFFNTEHMESLVNRDVREVLANVRKEVLKGCKLVFSRVFSMESRAENQHCWKLAVQLGATCSTELDPSITHVVSEDSGTEKSRWAVQEKKFLVNPRWIDAARYLWKKQPEEKYPVGHLKNS